MKKVLVIYNAAAGKGRFKHRLKKIEKYLKAQHFEYVIHKITKDEKARDTIKELAVSFDILIILGGDGTVHSVVNGIMSIPKAQRPRLLFLPFGTSNDYAKMQGMKKNIKKSLALLNTNNHRFVDVNKANSEYFLYAAALGKFSNVSYNAKWRMQKVFGKFGYLLNAFNDLFKPYKFNVSVNGLEYQNIFLVLVTSGTRVGGFNIARFTDNPTLSEHEVHIKLFKRKSFMSWFKVIIFYFFRGLSFKSDLHLFGSKLMITTTSKATWNFDGEKSNGGPLEITVLPCELDVYYRK